MKLLLDYLNSIYAMSPALIEHLGNVLKYTEVPKKDYLLKAGRICENVWFIEKGLARCFYTKDDEDISSWFMKEGDVIFSVKSFYKQEPSYESIQMLEDSSLFYITYKELQYIYINFLEFNYIRGVLTEKVQRSPGITSINIKLSNYPGALFNITMNTESGSAGKINGRIIHPQSGDVLILTEENSTYYLKKQLQKFFMTE